MTIIVFKVVPLIFQRVKGFVLDFPTCSTTPHQLMNIVFCNMYVGYPTTITFLPFLCYKSLFKNVCFYIFMAIVENVVISKSILMDNPFFILKFVGFNLVLISPL